MPLGLANTWRTIRSADRASDVGVSDRVLAGTANATGGVPVPAEATCVAIGVSGGVGPSSHAAASASNTSITTEARSVCEGGAIKR